MRIIKNNHYYSQDSSLTISHNVELNESDITIIKDAIETQLVTENNEGILNKLSALHMYFVGMEYDY